MLNTQEKIELFKIIYHPGKEIGKTLDEANCVIKWLTDADGKPGDVKPKSHQQKK